MPAPQSGHPIVAIVITLMIVFASLGAAWQTGYIAFKGLPSKAAPIAMPNDSIVPVVRELPSASTAAELREGVYSLTGFNAGSTQVNYTGTVSISRREESSDVYDLVWSIAGGTQGQVGVGILNEGILSVGYFESRDGTVADAGSVSYILVDNSHLEGEWASLQGGMTGTEYLKL